MPRATRLVAPLDVPQALSLFFASMSAAYPTGKAPAPSDETERLRAVRDFALRFVSLATEIESALVLLIENLDRVQARIQEQDSAVKPDVIRAHADDDGFTAMLPFFKHDSVQMWSWVLQQARPSPHQTREVLPGLLDIISNPTAIMELSEVAETCNARLHPIPQIVPPVASPESGLEGIRSEQPMAPSTVRSPHLALTEQVRTSYRDLVARLPPADTGKFLLELCRAIATLKVELPAHA